MSDIIGIDENSMDTLILDIKDRIDLCNSLFNEIEDCVEKTLSSYSSSDKNLLGQKWDNLKASFPTLTSNLETITNDLVRAKNGYKVVDKIATTKVINSEDNISIKEVKE